MKKKNDVKDKTLNSKKKFKLFEIFSNNKKDSPAVKNYKKKRAKKNKNKKYFNGKFSFDVLDLLIIVVIVVILSCVSTGLILNHQYRRNTLYIDKDIIKDENLKDFLNTYTEVVNNYYEEIDQDKMIEAALEGMMDFLEDNYSIYLDKEQTDNLNQSLDGSYTGIGVIALGNVVTSVYKDSPAEAAGIKANDEIIEVNGNEINLDNYTKLSEYLKKDEENTVVVKRDGKKLSFKVDVTDVEIPSTIDDVIYSKDQKNKIGYIGLMGFTAHSIDDFQESLIRLENEEQIDSLIIDLRDNTGGYLNSAYDIASIFLDKDKVIYSLENKDGTKVFRDETKESKKYKVIVLINSNTASAAEVLASALKDSYGATIVGSLSYGKGTVQTVKYNDDTMIKYTSAKWLRPNGDCVDGIGITPDYEEYIERKENIIYDKPLDRAIQLLS